MLTQEQRSVLRGFLDGRPPIGSPPQQTKEKQLLDALDRYALESGWTIDMGPTCDLTVPLVGDVVKTVSLADLMAAPDVVSKTTVTRPHPATSGLADPVWPHPAAWDKKND